MLRSGVAPTPAPMRTTGPVRSESSTNAPCRRGALERIAHLHALVHKTARDARPVVICYRRAFVFDREPIVVGVRPIGERVATDDRRFTLHDRQMDGEILPRLEARQWRVIGRGEIEAAEVGRFIDDCRDAQWANAGPGEAITSPRVRESISGVDFLGELRGTLLAPRSALAASRSP